MEFSTDCADALGEGGFNVHVDVLLLDGELEVSGRDVSFYVAKASFDLLKFFLGENACFDLCAGVRDGPRDIVRIKSPIIGDGLSIVLNEIGGCF